MAVVTVNGEPRTVQVPDDTPLLWVLREELGLTGTKFGCGKGLCGACTVHVGGAAVRSCVTPVGSVQGQAVTTIEGLAAKTGAPQAVAQAWAAVDVVQCGYCQPGQVMAATALLQARPQASDAEIVAGMTGNLCRCGTYPRILAAVQQARALLAGGAKP